MVPGCWLQASLWDAVATDGLVAQATSTPLDLTPHGGSCRKLAQKCTSFQIEILVPKPETPDIITS